MILRMMKKSKAMLTVICVMMMLAATGCGKTKETPIPVDISSENTQDREDAPEDSINEDAGEDGNRQEKGHTGEDAQEDASQQEKGHIDKDEKAEDGSSQEGQTSGREELAGDVQSMGQDSFVICKVTEESDGVAVVAAPGTEEADDLVTVYVNQNCVYQYETVRNGGVNPEDISSREGSFGDLQEGMSCLIKGSWRDGSFYADSIVMMEFV